MVHIFHLPLEFDDDLLSTALEKVWRQLIAWRLQHFRVMPPSSLGLSWSHHGYASPSSSCNYWELFLPVLVPWAAPLCAISAVVDTRHLLVLIRRVPHRRKTRKLRRNRRGKGLPPIWKLGYENEDELVKDDEDGDTTRLTILSRRENGEKQEENPVNSLPVWLILADHPSGTSLVDPCGAPIQIFDLGEPVHTSAPLCRKSSPVPNSLVRFTLSSLSGHDGFPGLRDRTRVVKMTLTKDIPPVARVAGFNCRVWYHRQPVYCTICKKSGHRGKDCPAQWSVPAL
ncbi:hypothetical protein OS493_016897 [Desmophyllum pertusum]|uniref:CCHC-type domain-containing protein n=1 Tax=Desmophyllum pertusum TaxID=174260 RepID=A0A9W9YNM6_9CNID|nr:hypothetical protein OS493_016897 [Desmophyllum pertusum]